MLQQAQYPIHITFKIWTLSPNRVSVTDNQGKLLFVMRQKAFRLKEAIVIYGDEQLKQPLYEIKADRIIDFSARYNFNDTQGTDLGGIKRQGMKSLWSAKYDIFDRLSATTPMMTIKEDDPWVKVFDALFSEIPIVGMFTGYVFNPTYTLARTSGENVMKLSKLPGFLSREFTIQKVDRLEDSEELQAILSILMMIFLERSRG
ncbi:hypothetical protein [Chamaesiphon sp. VAR_48_metabat_403]|uniref:hypothetical protein n=1 Tax=Chamaesiphon sp. VAR_48_metabat_403 TaxID=2964700 RepID=UPI00286E50F4|nr:hypothetical protein [Chamaesiphon sp. VAR_48_metabat_403]